MKKKPTVEHSLEKLTELRLAPLLWLPKRIVKSIPEDKAERIRNAMATASQNWKSEKLTSLKKENAFHLALVGSEPWRLAGESTTSPLWFLVEIYFSRTKELEKAVERNEGTLLYDHEYLAIAIVDTASKSTFEDIAYTHCLLSTNTVNHLLITFTEKTDFEGANALAFHIYKAVDFSRQARKDDDYKKLLKVREKQIENFANRKVTFEEINWIKVEGKRMKAENDCLKRWGIAGKLATKLHNKITQKRVDDYLKEAGL